ncbi:MAG: glutamate-5-semialdehyde dehydrogenase [Candidatus Sericytochromatia bacterium]|nr:glutamate-5-semialdehyde dehydrogenase [Candidatus Sericytochromatia bacterium]
MTEGTLEAEVRLACRRAAAAAPVLARTDGRLRRAVLMQLATLLEDADIRTRLLEANASDVAQGVATGMAPALLDRLRLDPDRIRALAAAVRAVADLPDPLGEVVRGWTRPDGLQLSQVRVPLGVVGFIYEARPNVTLEAAALCLRSGNALVLRGSGSALTSNRALASVVRDALAAVGLPEDLVVLIDRPEREAATILMRQTGLIDVLIPRGGAALIRRVVEEARVPVLETGVGICHVLVDSSADPTMAEAIVLNAKTQRPGVCNAAETLLLARDYPACEALLARLASAGVTLVGCPRARTLAEQAGVPMTPADEETWDTEHLALVMGVRVIDDLDEALAHVARHGTRHSEAIVTRDHARAERFLLEVDAAAVYVNASTRFTDGGEFGFGAEVGISTQKLHARGPMGLRELTTVKTIGRGSGQVRT